MTHTYATLQVSNASYAFIRKQLLNAGYDHAVNDDKGELDMQGIALTKQESGKQPSCARCGSPSHHVSDCEAM